MVFYAMAFQPYLFLPYTLCIIWGLCYNIETEGNRFGF